LALGICRAQAVKANVLFFDRRPASVAPIRSGTPAAAKRVDDDSNPGMGYTVIVP